jgi:hypothetical protein
MMRRIFALLASAAASFPLAAQAAVSDDLTFCSKLTDRSERVACYHAAARIAENARTRKVSGVAPAASTALQSQPAAAKAPPVAASHALSNPFDGFYIAGGGTYGWSTGRPFSTASSSIFPSVAVNPQSNGDALASGPSGVVAAGYNVTTGRLLFGLEADARFGRESWSTTGVTTASALPTSTGSNGIATASYTINSNFAAHLSARAGGMIGDTLVFAKLGVGVTHVTNSHKVDATGLSSCTAFSMPLPFVPGVCSQRGFGGAGSLDFEQWLPSLLFGVGAERNFGQFFARVNAEAEMVSSKSYQIIGVPLSDSIRTTVGGTVVGTGPGGAFNASSNSDFNGFWTFRVGAMVGMRF